MVGLLHDAEMVLDTGVLLKLEHITLEDSSDRCISK